MYVSKDLQPHTPPTADRQLCLSCGCTVAAFLNIRPFYRVNAAVKIPRLPACSLLVIQTELQGPHSMLSLGNDYVWILNGK
jgi:hypothetical protein